MVPHDPPDPSKEPAPPVLDKVLVRLAAWAERAGNAQYDRMTSVIRKETRLFAVEKVKCMKLDSAWSESRASGI